MTKTKIFTSTIGDIFLLELEINEFLASGDIEVIKIEPKMSIFRYTVLILYKEK